MIRSHASLGRCTLMYTGRWSRTKSIMGLFELMSV
jgi:hypothetical protein